MEWPRQEPLARWGSSVRRRGRVARWRPERPVRWRSAVRRRGHVEWCAAGTEGLLEVLGVASEMRGAGAGFAAAEGTVGPLTVRAASARGVAAAGTAGPLEVLGAASGTRGAAAAGTAGPLEGVLGAGSGCLARPRRERGGAGVLGAAAGTRGAVAAGTAGPLEALGTSDSGARPRWERGPGFLSRRRGAGSPVQERTTRFRVVRPPPEGEAPGCSARYRRRAGRPRREWRGR